MSLYGGIEISGRPDQRVHRVIALSESDIVRFWSKVDIRGPDECWLWLGGKTAGYGVFMTKGNVTLRANRIVAYLEWMNDEKDATLHACHRCDNPPCCNPSHIFYGTRFDNFQDCSRKRRCALQRYPTLAQGERNNAAKLSREQALRIKESPERTSLLATRFNVSRTMVKAIRSGRSWACLSLEE